MELETKRLLLRTMTIDDVDDLLRIFSDPKVMASFGGMLFERPQMVRWVERNLSHQNEHGYGLFSIIIKEDGELIGDCGLEHMTIDGSQEVEIGYDVRSDYWNRGLATEAARAVRDFAFRDLNLDGVISLIRPENVASRKVAEKIGMTKEREILRDDRTYWVYSRARDLPDGNFEES